MKFSMETLGFHLYNTLDRFYSTPIPNPGTREAPPELEKKVNLVIGFLAWGGTAAGVIGVLITGAMMAVSHKQGQNSEHMGRLGMVIGGCVLVASAGPIVEFVFK